MLPLREGRVDALGHLRNGTGMTTTKVTTSVGEVTVTATEYGTGRPYLVLHGGAGPVSVGRFAELLAASGDARVIAPTHPGFNGTPRPERLASVAGLAEVYSELLNALRLEGVTVIGNSVGGWIAAELALLQNPRLRKLVLVDAGGLKIDAHPAADVNSLTLDQVMALSYRNPEKFRVDPSRLTDQQKAAMAGNRAALRVYAGDATADTGLLDRLRGIRVPTLVVWGDADRIFPMEHGEAFAAGIPGARLHVIEEAGHLPQLEAPEVMVRVVRDFAAD
jgi:pimeloyl-ACP methyl ester carboxylesterase